LASITSVLDNNVIRVKKLRSLAGKLSNCARLLTAWRPFLGEVWAALREATGASSNAPSGTIWVKQVAHSLSWFATFLRGFDAGISRPFSVDAFLEPDDAICITLDASPWGFGAVLQVQQHITEFFAAPISD